MAPLSVAPCHAAPSSQAARYSSLTAFALQGEDDTACSYQTVNLLSAVCSATPVSLPLYTQSTGQAAFPPELAALIEKTEPPVLPLLCNGALEYELRGVRCRHTAEWRPEEPVGGGDLHSSVLRGNNCDVIVRSGPETGYKQELLLTGPSAVEGLDNGSLGPRLAVAVARWQGEFPGVSASEAADGSGWTLDWPAEIAPGHEAHFGMVLEEFLDHVDAGAWPAGLIGAIQTRYTLLAHAHALGESSKL